MDLIIPPAPKLANRVIELKLAGFDLPDGRTLFDRLNLNLEPGQRLGIVGRNGLGKTTLLRALAGLTPAPCRKVKPPRVAETPAALECRLLQIISLADLDGRPAEHFLALGQVVGVHIDRRFLKDGLFDTAAARPIARCGYRGDYAEVDHLFELVRPAV